jgi:hypothetical protein
MVGTVWRWGAYSSPSLYMCSVNFTARLAPLSSKSDPRSAFAAGRGFADLAQGSEAKPTRSEKVEVGLIFDF